MDIDRVIRNTPTTLVVNFTNDEEPVDADATVAVVVVDENGSQVASGSATHQGATGSGQYALSLPAQADLGLLTATWSASFDSAPGSVSTFVEIVGGVYFTVAELRASDSAIADTAKYPTEKLVEARHATETEFERICGRAFVPRYFRETVKGNNTDTIGVTMPDLIEVIRVNGVAPSGDFELDGRLLRNADRSWWDCDTDYTIEYEYGLPMTPFDLKQAALRRARGKLTAAKGRIDERATIMQVPDFGTFNLSTPGQRGAHTGIPDIDVVLDAYAFAGGTGIR